MMKTRMCIFASVVLLFLFSMPGCEGDASKASEDRFGPVESAALMLGVQWPGEAGEEGGPDMAASQVDMQSECVSRGVKTVQVDVESDFGATLASATFDCAVGQGALTGIEPQPGCTVKVSGLNNAGIAIYEGRKTGVTLLAGMNNIGTIQLYPLGVLPPGDENITAERFGGAGDGDGMFRSPKGIAIDQEGMVYVSDTTKNQIQKFTANGVFVKKWDLSNSWGMVVHNERLYAVSAPDRVVVFDLEGTLINEWEVPDFGSRAVIDIDADNDGILYVLDNTDRAVKKFSALGAYLGSFQVDTIDDWEWGPVGIAVAGGQVFVTDAANHKVNVWGTGGTYLRSWGQEGAQNGEFHVPTGIVAANNGTSIIVGDINLPPTGARLQRFTLTGQHQATSRPDNGNFYPVALAVSPGGEKIYIVYSGTYEIRIIDVF